MENRMGVKDMVVIALILVLIVLVGLSSCGYNRQWDTIKSIEKQVVEQSNTIAQLAKALRSGRVATHAGTGAVAPIDTPAFARHRVARTKADYTPGGTLVDVFSVSTVDKLTPLVPADLYQKRISEYVLDQLIERDPQTLKWMPRLATRWEVSDDNLTYTYHLRPDAVFSDGTPVTSEDVVFTYNMIKNTDINCPHLKPYYEKVASVNAPDPYRVVFTLTEPYFKAMEITGEIQILAKHYYSQFTPDEFNSLPGLIFGSGPYKLPVDPAEWRPSGKPIELVRNEQYWGPRATFDRLVWQLVNDEVTRETRFRNGETDSYVLPMDRYRELKADNYMQSRGKLYEYEALKSGYAFIAWNQEREGKPTRFSDKRVRQAMSMLIHRDHICSKIMNGLGRPATGPFHPLGWQADPSIEPWPYDAQAAKALLAEAGFKDRDKDGVLDGPDGKPFRFKLSYPAGSPMYDAVMQLVRDACAEAGIVMTPDPLDFSIIKQRVDDRQFDAISFRWGGVVESDLKQLFHSEAIKDGGDNFISYRNPQVDTVIDQARVAMDEEERLKLWQEVHRLLHDDQPYAFLYTQKVAVYIDHRVKNVVPTRSGLNPRTEMYIPKDQQNRTE